MSATPTFDPASLPDDPKILRAMLLELFAQLRQEKHRNENLTTWINQLRRHQFGRKSEIFNEENQRLLDFIIEGTAALKPEPHPEPPPAPDRKGHGRARIPQNLPRDIYLHDVPLKERRCGCCRKELVVIGREESEQVDYVPASVHVKKHVRLKYGCPDSGCRGTVVLAPLPDQAVPKCKAAEGMLAFVATSKPAHHIPLYRMEEMLANQGFPVSRSTLWEWIRGASEALEPVYRVMKAEVQASDIVETDETPVALWDHEHDVLKKGRQWTYINADHTVFDFSPDRKKSHPEAFLRNTKGYLLSDAYAGFRSIARDSGKLVNVFCWSHARRQFWKARDTDRERAEVALAYIRALYQVEREGRDLSPSRRGRLRRRASKPILDRFKAWLEEQGLVVLPKSPIGKAIAYTLKNWTELTRFLEDGRLRIDNNRSEQQLRPIALGRKNWLRYESERGGRVGAILASLVASCRRHKRNPFEYFRDVLKRIATHPARKIRDLTPARWKPRDTS